jgi:hypothetical protein
MEWHVILVIDFGYTRCYITQNASDGRPYRTLRGALKRARRDAAVQKDVTAYVKQCLPDSHHCGTYHWA